MSRHPALLALRRHLAAGASARWCAWWRPGEHASPDPATAWQHGHAAFCKLVGANAASPSGQSTRAALERLRALLDSLPPHPTPDALQTARQLLRSLCDSLPDGSTNSGAADATRGASGSDTSGRPGLRRALLAAADPAALASPPAPGAPDAEAIPQHVAQLLAASHARRPEAAWVRSGLPELLGLLPRLRLRAHPHIEHLLSLALRRGPLPGAAPRPPPDAGPSAGGGGGGGGAAPLPGATAPPPAFRLAVALGALPLRGHGVWQELAERHLAGSGVAALEGLGGEQLSALVEALARAGYHPVALLGHLADRLLPHVPTLRAAALARAVHGVAVLRAHEPRLTAALAAEALRRMDGDGAADVDAGGSHLSGGGGGGARGGGGGPLQALSALLGSAAGSRGLGRPDAAHRAPSGFALDDCARLAEAAVYLGAGDGAGSGSGGGGGVARLADALLAAVAGEAEPRAAAYMPGLLAAVERAAAAAAAAREGGGMNGVADASALAAAEVAERVQPLARLLEALVEGAGGGGSGSGGGSGGDASSDAAAAAAAGAARALAAQAVVPALALLEPHLQLRHLALALAALLPGGAAALRQPAAAAVAAAYPPARAAAWPGAHGAVPMSPAEAQAQHAAVCALAAALRRRASPRDLSCLRPLLAAWHVLAAVAAGAAPAAATGAVGAAAVLRTARAAACELLPCVAEAVASHGPKAAPSAAEGLRFLLSCAHLGARPARALDVAVRPLAGAAAAAAEAALAVHAAARPFGQASDAGVGAGGVSGVGGGGGGSIGGSVPWPLPASAVAALAWAAGQLGYGDEQLLLHVQTLALAFSSPSIAAPSIAAAAAAAAPPAPALPGPPRAAAYAAAAIVQLGRLRPAGELAAAGLAGVAGGPGGPGGPSGGGGGWDGAGLGPLELGDVAWGLAVCGLRTHGGAHMRELYMRAASRGVVTIDDPRWLRLAQVHLLLLLRWAGGLDEAASAQLGSGWFNAISYAWAKQAAQRGGQLAGRSGVPPAADAGEAAFRADLAAAAAAALRDAPHGGGYSGWRLWAARAWRMPAPSSEVTLTVPLLVQAAAPPPVGGRGGGSASGGPLVAISGIVTSDEVLQAAAVAEDKPTDEAAGSSTDSSRAAGRRAAAAGAGGPLLLLGPARWRQTALEQLGVAMRPVRQAEWERATEEGRRELLREALRV